MKQHKDEIRLRHMLDAAEKAYALVRGKVREDLDNDEILGFAIVRLLEVIGEAASSISAELRVHHSGIPWKQMIATRNHLIHGYFDIDFDIIWNILKNDLPELINNLKVIVPDSCDFGTTQ